MLLTKKAVSDNRQLSNILQPASKKFLTDFLRQSPIPALHKKAHHKAA